MTSQQVRDLTRYWEHKLVSLRAGKIKFHFPAWSELTSDKEVLDTVTGLPIYLDDDFDCSSTCRQFQYPLGLEEHDFVEQEISRLLKLGAIVPTTHEEGEFISPIFVRPKDDGAYRLILNLKKLNEHTEYIHFKMDTLASILTLVRPGAYMAKVDIKDAYYSVPIKPSDQKKLKFLFDGSLYQFTVLPNGYSPGPRKFTKLLKPPLSVLRLAMVTIAAYLDDMFTTNKSYQGCMDNIQKICDMFERLGFVIHPKKSMFEPSTIMEFLGFIINSRDMTVSLTVNKKERIAQLCEDILSVPAVSIRAVARLLGNFTSSFIAIPEGRLFYRAIEHDKTSAVARNHGDYDAMMKLTPPSIKEVLWWMENVMEAYSPILRPNPSVVLKTDACLEGWGACRDSQRTGGLFSEDDRFRDSKMEHINILEAKAVFFGLTSLCAEVVDSHIHLLIDNTSAVGAIKNMGSSKSPCLDREVKIIWDWAITRNNWLSASHIPGVLNVEADEESRSNETRLEWKLDESLFYEVVQFFLYQPEVDLFASRINTQLTRFFAYRPDPEAEVIDAFSVSWENIRFYAFPPFNCISRVIQKIVQDKATGILIVPDWPSQIWYHMFLDIILIDMYLPPRPRMLYLPNNLSAAHPLEDQLTLRVALVSGEN